VRHIVVLGAGYGGLRAALDLDRLTVGMRSMAITVIDRNLAHELVVELHELAVGRVSEQRLRLPLNRLLSGRRVQLLTGTVHACDLAHRTITMDNGILQYDHLIFAPGSVADYFTIPGLEAHALPLKSVADAVRIREHLRRLPHLARAAHNLEERQRLLQIVVGGAGFTGIELAGELVDWMDQQRADGLIGGREGNVVVVEATGRTLPGFADDVARDAATKLARRGVQFQLLSPISAVEPGIVRLASDRHLPTGMVIWTGGVMASPLASTLQLPTGTRGRIKVDRYLHPEGYPEVNVIGDSALIHDPRTSLPWPPSAQLAVQHGRLAARNVVAAIQRQPLHPYVPGQPGEVISLGRRDAVATVGTIALRGTVAALAKRAAAVRYVRSLGGAAFLDRFGLASAPPLGAVQRPPALPQNSVAVPETAGGTTWKSGN